MLGKFRQLFTFYHEMKNITENVGLRERAPGGELECEF